MKQLLYSLSVVCVLLGVLSFKRMEPKRVLKITINNLKDVNNPILIGVFNSEAHFSGKKLYKKYLAVPTKDKKAVVYINDLDYGTYAISLFQDKNRDMKLNTNFIGVPTEPYAFSNNIKPKLSAPEYNQCVFQYDDNFSSMTIDLIQ